MKRRILSAIWIICAMCVMCGTLAGLTGCSDETSALGDDRNAPAPKAANGGGDYANMAVDVDLTKFNTSMAYVKVCEMLNNPNDYIGKTVRMKGGYSPYYVQNLDVTIQSVMIISEVCCPAYVDFKWDGDFPENENDEIEIVGVFESHDDYPEYGTLYRVNLYDLTIL